MSVFVCDYKCVCVCVCEHVFMHSTHVDVHMCNAAYAFTCTLACVRVCRTLT